MTDRKRSFLVELGVAVGALAVLVAGAFATIRGASLVLRWTREGSIAPPLAALLLGGATLYASFALGTIQLSYRILLARLGSDPEFRRRLAGSREDRWNRRLVDLILIASVVFPMISLESVPVETLGTALAKGISLGLPAALAARLHARLEYGKGYSLLAPLLCVAMFVAFNATELGHPTRLEWLAGVTLVAVLVLERVLGSEREYGRPAG